MNRQQRRAARKGAQAGQGVGINARFEAALGLHRAGHWREAEQGYRELLLLDPGHVAALHALGVLAYQQGRSDEAGKLITRAIAIDPQVAAFHINLGNVLQTRRDWAGAVACYRRALVLEPGAVEAHFNLGVWLDALRDFDGAEASYRQALVLDPRHAEAYGNLGNVLQAQGRSHEALEAYRCALLIKPDFARAHYNLGIAFEALGELDLAAGAYEEALEHQPDLIEARYNLGVLLQAQGRLDDAISAYRAVLARQSQFAEAHYNLGVALQAQTFLEEALLSYQRAVAVKPDYAKALSNLAVLEHYREKGSPASILESARRFGAIFPAVSRPAARDPNPARRLRIGYVSGDLRTHPVGYFLANVLASHDTAQIEVFCYSNSSTSDAMTARLRGAGHHWREIAALPDDAMAALIRRDEIDILIDLSGHTGQNRLPVFALRPAPVQASWLGFPGTVGLDALDYVLSDAATVPPGAEHWFHEAVVLLPHARFCYQPPDDAPAPAPPPCLSRGFVTFGSFNNIAKTGPAVIRLWADVLADVPQSRLVLKWEGLDEEARRQRLSDDFARAGVSPKRLELRGRSPHREMLGEYADIDIALDPFPFGGGLTSCEALWMGVPVLTLPGERPASRQTLGFLQNLGLEDWAAASPEDFRQKAALFAADTGKRRQIRASLRARMAGSPLCNGPFFTSALEAAFHEMWRRHCAGEPPCHIAI